MNIFEHLGCTKFSKHFSVPFILTDVLVRPLSLNKNVLKEVVSSNFYQK